MYMIRLRGKTFVEYGLFETEQDAIDFLGENPENPDVELDEYSFHQIPVNEPGTTLAQVATRVAAERETHRLRTG